MVPMTSPTPPESDNRSWSLWELVAFSAALVATQFLGNFIATPGHPIAGFSPALGLAFGVMWRRGVWLWPCVALVSAFAAAMSKVSPVMIPVMMMGDTLTSIATVWLTRKWTAGRQPFKKLRNASLFLWAAVVVTGISAACEALAFCWAEPTFQPQFVELLAARWLAQLLGLLLVAPLTLAWWQPDQKSSSSPRRLEFVIFSVLLVVINLWVFSRSISLSSLPIPDASLFVPLGMWSVFRFGLRGSSTTALAICVMSLFGAAEMLGPFGREGGVLISSSLMMAMGNSVVFGMSMMLMSALMAERREADIDVRKTDVRYRILFEHSPDAVFVVDMADSKLLEFNERLPELLKCSVEQLRQHGYYDFENHGVALSESSSVLSMLNPRTKDIDIQYRCFDGGTVDVNVTYSGIDFFGRPAHLMIARDVTKRRREELLLRESEERFRALSETIPAIVSIQRNGQPEYVNPAASKLSGYSIEELLKKNFVDLLHSDDRGETQRQVQKCLERNSKSWRQEVSLKTKTGAKRQIDLSVTPIKFDGKSAWLASAMDVTDRREAEAEVRQLTAELFHSARLRLLGELVAGVAHDLRHPISVIDHLADGKVREIQNGDSQTPEQLRMAFATILEQSQRAIASLSQVQNLARRHETDRRRLELLPLIQDAIRVLRLNRQWCDVPIDVNAADLSLRAYVDRAEFTQVLLDLLRNGLEAMEETPDSQRRIVIQIQTDEPGWLRISITDFGTGVAESFLPHLFEAFKTTKSEGLGLGLNLCQTIIEDRHGGHLKFEAVPTGGATFHIRLRSEPKK